MENNPLNITQDGLVAFQADGSFAGRTLIEGANVTITNADGIAGDPEISAPAGSAPASNYTLLQSTAISSGSTQVNFSGIGIENYNDIRIVMTSITYSIAGGGFGSMRMYLKFSTDSLSTFVPLEGTFGRTGTDELTIAQAFSSISQTMQSGLQFFNPNNAYKYGTQLNNLISIQYLNYMAFTKDKINALRFGITTTFTGGTIAIYGR